MFGQRTSKHVNNTLGSFLFLLDRCGFIDQNGNIQFSLKCILFSKALIVVVSLAVNHSSYSSCSVAIVKMLLSLSAVLLVFTDQTSANTVFMDIFRVISHYDIFFCLQCASFWELVLIYSVLIDSYVFPVTAYLSVDRIYIFYFLIYVLFVSFV